MVYYKLGNYKSLFE